MNPEHIARAYHCPLHVAEEIISGEKPWHRGVLFFGPVRCYWRDQWPLPAWMLDNQPIRKIDLGVKWRRECIRRQNKRS